MNATDLAHYIRAHEIEAQIIHLAEPTPTVETAANAMGVQPDQIGKSILFLAGDVPYLVIANGLTRIDRRRLAGYLGLNRKKVRLADGEQVERITGYPVGTVPPFGHPQPIKTILESRVLEQALIYVGGGEINALMRLTTGELRRVVQPAVVSLAEQGEAEA
jgi:prolyl-tRNA editing enzyme YbaK/EbsC (Cys-tRNA(Pro) deacylase)